MNILVVEDEQDIREMIGEYLKSKGHSVAMASNGVDALDMVPQFNPELILTDYKMPRMGGREMAKTVRDMGYEWPIYYISGNAHKNGLQQSITDGIVQGVISKPFQLEDLDRAIENSESEIEMLRKLNREMQALSRNLEALGKNFNTFKQQYKEDNAQLRQEMSSLHKLIYGTEADESTMDEPNSMKVIVNKNKEFREKYTPVLESLELNHKATEKAAKWIKIYGGIFLLLYSVFQVFTHWGDKIIQAVGGG